MSNFYDWHPEQLKSVVTITSVSLGFAVYWFLSINQSIKAIFFKRFDHDKAWINYVVYQKLCGMAFMGLVPGCLIFWICKGSFSEFGLNLNHFQASLSYTLVIGSIILILNYFAARKESNLSMYPQMRIEHWNKKTVLVNALAWTVYLLSYEFMYRGLLLMACYQSFGFWPSVAVNLSFYSATHIAKGWRETFASFPYGLLLCLITVSTGSIFVAFATHLILALSNDYYSVKHHPKMKFV